MGGLTSKHVEEVIGSPETPECEEQQGTPKRTHILAVDPRSPSDYISRTPIAVSNTPDKDGDQTPCDKNVVKTLTVDPRSPTIEVSRTPIQVESRDMRRRPVSLRPTRLTQLESMSSSDDTTSETSDETDPRSPTCKVPRTPLENKEHEFDTSEAVKQDISEGGKESEAKAENTAEASVNMEDSLDIKTETDNTSEKLQVRRPLSSVVNTITPRGILQARQCRNVEVEYTKSQKTIINQLEGQENKVASNTQFVETI